LVSLLKLKIKYNFGLILDIPSYELNNIDLENTKSITIDIINKYNISHLISLKYKDKKITKLDLLSSIIDNLIITINPDTYERFCNYMELLKKTRNPSIGIIVKISKNSLNVNNYLSNSSTWNVLNELIVEEEGKHNINIIGLINDDRIKLGNFELSRAICLINDFTDIEIKNNELLLKTKKNKHLSMNIVNEHTFINNTNTELLNNYICTMDFSNIKFKKYDNKNINTKEQKALDELDDNLNKGKGDKNKELLEDEDEYDKIYIIKNLVSRLNINCFNNNSNNINLISLYHKLYPDNNSFLQWYDELNEKIYMSRNVLDKMKDATIKYITYGFDYINSYYKK
jgi:hypothetical protein